MEILLKNFNHPMIIDLPEDIDKDDIVDNLKDMGGDWKRFLFVQNKSGAILVYNIDEIVSLSVVP